MDVVISDNFDHWRSGAFDEFRDGYLHVKAEQKFSVVQAERSWFPFMTGKCLRFDGIDEERPNLVEMFLPPNVVALNMVMRDADNAIRDDISFWNESLVDVPSEIKKSGQFRLVSCLSSSGSVKKIRFYVYKGVVHIDNLELFFSHDYLPEPSGDSGVFYEHFDAAVYADRLPIVETLLLRIQSEGFLKVTSDFRREFPYTLGKFVLASGNKETPRLVTIKLKLTAASVRFTLGMTSSAIKGTIDFHDGNGVKLGSIAGEAGGGQIVEFASKTGIDEIRFTAVGDLALGTFEVVERV